MFNKNLTNDELQCYVPYLKENLPKSIVIYNSVQQEITQKYEIPQTATVLQIDIGDPTPGFVLHRKEGQDNIITIFCPEEKDQLVSN